MSTPFFSGSSYAKLDEKNRFVLPQEMRYQLVENGVLECTIALGMGGCLALYRKSAIEEIVARFRKKKHIAKYQKFFTLFFSTLHHTTCDKVGRITLPSVLKNGAGIETEVVIAGALDKIEIWPKEVYEKDLAAFIGGDNKMGLQTLMEEAFSLLGEDEDDAIEQAIERVTEGAVTL